MNIMILSLAILYGRGAVATSLMICGFLHSASSSAALRFEAEVWSNLALHGSNFAGKDFVQRDSTTGSGRFKHGPCACQIPQSLVPVNDWGTPVADGVQPVELREGEAVFKAKRDL